MSNREAVIAKALSKLHTNESPAGSNKTEFGVWYGFNGVSWCAIFVSWAFGQVMPKTSPLFGLQSPKGYAGTQEAARQMKAKGWLRIGQPQPGDIFIHRSSATHGHTGIIIKGYPDGSADTVEGNTNGKGGRDGGSVLKQTRSKAYMTWIFNPPY